MLTVMLATVCALAPLAMLISVLTAAQVITLLLCSLCHRGRILPKNLRIPNLGIPKFLLARTINSKANTLRPYFLSHQNL